MVRVMLFIAVVAAMMATLAGPAGARTLYLDCGFALHDKPRQLTVGCKKPVLRLRRVRWHRWGVRRRAEPVVPS